MGYLQELTIKFFNLLIRRGRSNLVIYIVHQFIELYRKQNGFVSAVIKTAVNMPDEIKQQIIEKVRKATKKDRIDLKEQIDRNLLGGFILYYDGNSYDASIKHDIDKIKNVLTI